MRSEFEDDDSFPSYLPPPTAPVTSFDKLNFQDELLDQYIKAKKLRDTLDTDPEATLAGKAAVYNSVSTIIERLTKLKTDIYNAERLKALENTLIECLQETDQALTDKFLALYEAKVGLLKAS